VVDFSKLIGAESDYTHKREIVPDGMFYKCENLQKKLELEKHLFQGSKKSYIAQILDFSADFTLHLVNLEMS
jgi:hypothetical protein